MRVSFPAQNIALQSSTELCKLLKSGPSGPFFVPAGTTEIRRHPVLLSPDLSLE
jgi:hypothetical protein